MKPLSIGAVLTGGWFLFLSSAGTLSAQGSLADYQRALGFAATTRGKVFLDEVVPHWSADGEQFWYRRELRGKREFVLVDCRTARRRPAFDHRRLAAALAVATKAEVHADALPFRAIALHPQAGLVFRAAGKVWQCDLQSYRCQPAGPGIEAPAEPREPDNRRGRRGGNRRGRRGGPPRPSRAPDGTPAKVKDHNLFVGDRQVTTDGVADNQYGSPRWSPDGKTLVFFRTVPGDGKEVPLIESSPKDQLAARFRTRPYPRPGDRFPAHRMLLMDRDSGKVIQVQADPVDFGQAPWPRWSRDGKTFTFSRTDRGHKRFRIFAVDTATGATRTVVDEDTKDYAAGDTFINSWRRRPQFLRNTDEVILQSERDGWNHLYLVDLRTGKRSRITRGEYVVRAIDRVDEERREVWFQASGKNPGEDPYHLHHYRVRLDGSGLVALTDGDGNHRVTYSPDRKYLIDTYSRVDLPPVTNLRRVADGSLLCELEKADIRDLLATGWRMPERFVAKGRDGKTDIHGVIYRPTGFDPGKKYPVIEDIYAGPHDSFVPKTFAAYRSLQAMCELGFILVKIDGMGTANRSKAFHDVCWQNVGDAGLPDRILWIRAAGKQYPCMDLDRVGIFGTSAGGQSSTGALLFHPEFYKVAVSSCGCHDNRLDKASWNEQWMGYPVGPHYAAQSNVTNAHKLQGKLFLIVGELDTNVPPESTMRVVDALVRADKDFDLLVLPGANHTSGGKYGDRRRWDFFVRHLHGVEPRWR